VFQIGFPTSMFFPDFSSLPGYLSPPPLRFDLGLYLNLETPSTGVHLSATSTPSRPGPRARHFPTCGIHAGGKSHLTPFVRVARPPHPSISRCAMAVAWSSSSASPPSWSPGLDLLPCSLFSAGRLEWHHQTTSPSLVLAKAVLPHRHRARQLPSQA
jgi:hypothetical protein